MTRRPWNDIYVRKSENGNGPELVFDSGTSGWVIPCTDEDLYQLEEVLVQWRHACETTTAWVTPFEQCRAEGHDWPSAKEGSTLKAGDLEACGRCKVRRHVTGEAS